MLDRIHTRSAVFVALLATASIALAACGSDSAGSSSESGGDGVASSGGSTGIERPVLDNGRTYTIEDIKATGAKTPKQYDVTGLPGAIDAWSALLSQKEYEARFYASHADAVSVGTNWAESVSGDEALVVGDDVLWEEGAKDRRQCNRSVAHSGCNYTARYGEFVILGNMILLCEGKDADEALETCEALTDLLG